MRMKTDDLIENLAQGLKPAPPLPPPGKRAAAWSLGAVLYVGLLVLGMGFVAGFTDAMGAPFWFSQAAALATGVLACSAAFAAMVPGLTSRAGVWAVATGFVWLATLLAAPGVAADWSAVGGASHEWVCVGFIVIGGTPLAVVLARMLRRGAPLRPSTTAAFVVLAAAALTNAGACFSLPHANGAVTFAWHGTTVLVLVVLAASTGRFVFAWRWDQPPSTSGRGTEGRSRAGLGDERGHGGDSR
jgi:hypothetical protein